MNSEDYINIIDEAWGLFEKTNPTDRQKALVKRLEQAWYQLGREEA